MYVLIVTTKIKAEHREAFIEATLEDARRSLQDEPGCLRFDVYQNQEEDNTIYLIEAYKDQCAAEAHLTTPHFLKWDEIVKDWFTESYEIVVCSNIFPGDDAFQNLRLDQR
jgi:quinol monooxygenase YgiN